LQQLNKHNRCELNAAVLCREVTLANPTRDFAKDGSTISIISIFIVITKTKNIFQQPLDQCCGLDVVGAD